MNRPLLFVPLALSALALGFFTGYVRFSQLAADALRSELEIVVRPKFNNEGYEADIIEHRPQAAQHAPSVAPAMQSLAPPQESLPPAPEITPEQIDQPVPKQGQILRTPRYVQVISRVYTIDRLYPSMTGPWSENKVTLLASGEPELCWITGCRVQMVGEDGRTGVPEQFMCHANLDINREEHSKLLGLTKPIDERLFTLSQGQLSVSFPPGCGIPMMSSETIRLITQVLNLNFPDEQFQVRHKVTIDFIRDRDLSAPMKPLYEAGISSLKSLEGESLVYDYADDGAPTASGLLNSMCMPGLKANALDELSDRGGRKFTGHWVVKPGREENRTRVTTLLNLPFDTTVHHIAVHLHPYAESLALVDLTTGTTLFESKATPLPGQIGLSSVQSFTSEAGLSLFKDHEYELISRYNNTSGKNSDSMAVMYLYLFDHEFQDSFPQPDGP